jgi:glycine/D-amino acid oxidase-like deaminating enzyme
LAAPERYDLAIIGGGIIGCSAAAFAAERGLRVILFECEQIAFAASGRNSGALQHPFDPFLAELYDETIAHYRELSDEGTEFQLPAQPAGLLLLSEDDDAVAAASVSIGGSSPDLRPEILDRQALRAFEQTLAPGLLACRLETGYPVVPASATHSFAMRARRAGATIEIGDEAWPLVSEGRSHGVFTASAREIPAQNVLVATGPWTSNVVPGWSDLRPIRSVWGVVATVLLPDAPHAILEELGIDRPGPKSEELFSMATAGSATSVGSTFLNTPSIDTESIAQRVLSRATRFVPGLATAEWTATRSCARPVAFDARPLIGAVPEIEGLFVCAGHGPWGISTGPGSARLVIDAMLGRSAIPDELSVGRLRDWVGRAGRVGPQLRDARAPDREGDRQHD